MHITAHPALLLTKVDTRDCPCGFIFVQTIVQFEFHILEIDDWLPSGLTYILNLLVLQNFKQNSLSSVEQSVILVENNDRSVKLT